MSAWPMPETEAQINGLRTAFSADINKPFELKPSFPYESPSPDQYRISPPVELQSNQTSHLNQPHQLSDTVYANPQQRHFSSDSYITPPVSANDSKPESPQFGYIHERATYDQVSPTTYSQPGDLLDSIQWNPTPIINQFNTAFSIPPAALAPLPPPTSYPLHSPTSDFGGQPYATSSFSPSYTSAPYPQQYMQQVPTPTSTVSTQQAQSLQQMSHPQQQAQTNYMAPTPIYVSARDWQQSVASVFDPGGLKRQWNYDSRHIDERIQKRMK